jgi:DNA-binding GntR family transcriptional regulator
VYGALRRAVLHGELVGGERLHLGRLARQHGVSLGVVREAVTRLAGERLLESTPQTGFRVPRLSQEHLADLTWARCRIEGLAIEESVRHGDTAWEGALVAAHHVLSVTPTAIDGAVNPAWMEAHRRFHAALAAGCPNTTLLVVRQQLFDEAELYRHRSSGLPFTARPNRRDVVAEHRELLDAALARHAERAAALVTVHLRRTAELAGHDTAPASW